jgi:alcohol dehydrogenase, propanol-preferring
MERTMKAAVVHAFGKPLTIEEVDVPRPGGREVLVKIEACGVCHTDLHAAEGDWPVKPRLPLIPGHEGVGHVAAVGADVGHVKEGDRVGIPLSTVASRSTRWPTPTTSVTSQAVSISPRSHQCCAPA